MQLAVASTSSRRLVGLHTRDRGVGARPALVPHHFEALNRAGIEQVCVHMVRFYATQDSVNVNT